MLQKSDNDYAIIGIDWTGVFIQKLIKVTVTRTAKKMNGIIYSRFSETLLNRNSWEKAQPEDLRNPFEEKVLLSQYERKIFLHKLWLLLLIAFNTYFHNVI